MKKKNLLMMALSLCLVAVVAVGGTLAYLTASADALTNTFKFADNMTVTLTESWNKDANQQADEIATETNDGYAYTNVVPGQKLYKAPTITLDTDVDAYMFVRVTVGANLSVDSYTASWTELENIPALPENQVVYYKAVDADDSEDLGTIFTHLNVASNPTGDLGNVKIEVAAIQQSGFTGDSAVLNAYNAAQFQGA